MIAVIEVNSFQSAKELLIPWPFFLETEHDFENNAENVNRRREEARVGLKKLSEKLEPVQLEIMLSLVVVGEVAR